MSQAISQRGRIIYIEPNNLPSIYCATTPNGSMAENVFWNPEDLNISVDLQVIIPSREYNRAENVDNLNYMKVNPRYGGYASALAGVDLTGKGNRFLTDDYTMINYQEILSSGSGSKELLGINSINIKFDPHMFPTVEMSFTDVRAASLMMPEEQKDYEMHGGNNASEGSACKSFFKSFFRFPYPRFLLSVKGQYGTYVTFTLTVENFNSKFNSETGNFDVTVRFIGLMYGLYTDIPFNYLFAAPDIGGEDGEPNKYWQSQVENGTFCFCEDGNTGAPIPRFSEFMKSYEQFNTNLQTSDSVGGISVLYHAIELRKRIGESEVLWKKFAKELRAGKKYMEFTPAGYKFIVFLTDAGNPDGVDETQDATKYKQLPGLAKEIADKLGISVDEMAEYFETCLKAEVKDGKRHGVRIPQNTDGSFPSQADFESFLPDLTTDEVAGVRKVFEDNKAAEHPVNGYIFYDESKFRQYLVDRNDEAQKEYDENAPEANEELGKLFKDSFGYTPSIGNIFRMIFAHLDTFLTMFYTTINNVGTTRRIKQFGITIEDTDIASNAGSNAYMPPFTGFYKDNPDTGLKERMYPGNHPQLSGIPEVNMVTTLFTGVDNLSNIDIPDDMNPDDEDTGQQQQPGTDNTSYGYHSTSIYDFYTDGLNPYSKLKRTGEDFSDDFGERLIKLFKRRVDFAHIGNGKVSRANSLDAFVEAEFRNYKASTVSGYNMATVPSYDVSHIDITQNEYPLNDGRKNYSLVARSEPVSAYVGGNFYEKKGNFLSNSTYKEFPDDYWKNTFNDFVYDGYALSTEPYETFRKYGIPATVWRWKKNGEKYEKIEVNGKPVRNYHGGETPIHPVVDGKPDTATYSEVLSFPDDELWFPSLRWEGSKTTRNILRAKGEVGKYINGKPNLNDVDKRVLAYYLLKCFDLKHPSHYLNLSKANIMNLPAFLYLTFSARGYYKNHESEFNSLPSDLKKDVNCSWDVLTVDGKYFQSFTESGGSGVFGGQFEPIYNQMVEIARSSLNNEEKFFDEDENTTYFNYEKTRQFHTDLVKFWRQLIQIHVPMEDSKYLSSADMEYAITSFIRKIQDSNPGSTEDTDEGEEITPVIDGELIEMTANAKMMESTYYSLKNLYDRWISTYPNNVFKLKSVPASIEAKKRRLRSEHEASYADKNFSEFDNFLFIDGFFNDISDDFYINMDTFFSMLDGQRTGKTNFSVLEFISMLCRENKLLFKGLPTINNFYSTNTIAEMFKPHNPYEIGSTMRRGAGNTYLIMYTYEPANKLGFGNESDKLGVGYARDGFSVADSLGNITDEAVRVFRQGRGINADVTAFGVTPGKQNQSYFTNVSIGMDNPRVTDVSIANKFNIAAAARNEGTLQGVGTGQDLFSIYSNRSYDCSVEMLGCANIMPMMYFQLNNVPMFRGVYRIMQVEHVIQNNTMKTKFVGTKVSKYAIPFNKEVFNLETLQMILNQYGQTDFSRDMWTIPNIQVSGDATTGFEVKREDGSVMIPLPQESSYDGKTFYLISARKQMNIPMHFPGMPVTISAFNNAGKSKKSYGKCASYVGAFVNAGFKGYGKQEQVGGGGIGSGFACSYNLPGLGFKVVGEMRNGVENFQPFEAGDIVTMFHPNKGSRPNAHAKPYGHVTMYTADGVFVSDYNQGSDYWCYGEKKVNGTIALQFRFAGTRDTTTDKKFGE